MLPYAPSNGISKVMISPIVEKCKFNWTHRVNGVRYRLPELAYFNMTPEDRHVKKLCYHHIIVLLRVWTNAAVARQRQVKHTSMDTPDSPVVPYG
jgi:hypothetical protein